MELYTHDSLSQLKPLKEKMLDQKPKLIWFVGLSGSGKSTVGIELEKQLLDLKFKTVMLDGDNIRSGINNDLGFSLEDRKENIRRIAEIAKLFMDSGIITICTFISPTEESRSLVKSIVGEENYIEVFVDTPIEVCEGRDVNGLYEKARKGIISDFTGVSSPFERPLGSDIIIDTTATPLMYNAMRIIVKIYPKLKYERKN